jgi:hypothetical protein
MGQFVSSAVQFVGAPNVKQAFENVHVGGIIHWAIFNGKSLLEKYDRDDPDESKQLFDAYIDALSANRSTSLYRVQTYEDLPAGGKIKPSTEPDRVFQFKLFLPDQAGTMSGFNSYGSDPAMEKIMAKLDAMEAKIAVLQSDDGEDEEKVGGFGASIMKFLEIPAVQQKIAGVFENFVDQLIPPKRMQNYPLVTPSHGAPAAMNGVPGNDEQIQVEKINNSIIELYKIDKTLGDNLEKLAAIAKADPARYRSLITMLNSMF